MLSDEEFQSSSYAERTETAINQNQSTVLGENCDEINLGDNDVPATELQVNGDGNPENSNPAVINSIDDHQVPNLDSDLYAQISPAPVQSSIKVTIREFEKRGDGMNAYMDYKLDTEAKGVVGFTKESYSTWRRFSDFLGLHGKIRDKYLAKGIVIPQPPEKSIYALTKTKTNSDPAMSRDVGILRARQLERYISRLVKHPLMRSDCDVRDFLTIESDLPKAIQTTTLSSFGVRKMFKNIQEVIYKMAIDMEEGDRWFEQVQSDVDDLDEALRKLYNFTENLVASRRDMASGGEQLGKALSILAACEESTPLSKSLSDLTDVTENVSAVWGKQAEMDNSKFSESIHEYIMLIGSLQDVFSERQRAWQQWQDAKMTLSRKRDQKTKIELFDGGRNKKSEQLEVEIEEVTQKMDQLGQDFEDLSKAIREEVVRFDAEKAQDMKAMLIEYMESMIQTHTEVLHLWQKFEQQNHNMQV